MAVVLESHLVISGGGSVVGGGVGGRLQPLHPLPRSTPESVLLLHTFILLLLLLLHIINTFVYKTNYHSVILPITLYRCEGCVETLFTRPSAACPECNTALRRNDFRVQQFEDLIVEKEVDIRKRILKMWVISLNNND